MAKKVNIRSDQFLAIKRMTSMVSVICIFLVVVCGMNAKVSIVEICFRATLVIISILFAQTFLLKALSTWDISKELKKKNILK